MNENNLSNLTFKQLRAANKSRYPGWTTETWTPSEWLAELLRKTAALIDIRERDIPDRPGPANQEIADGIAILMIDLDSFAALYGVDLGAAVTRVFDAVSEEVGADERLVEPGSTDPDIKEILCKLEKRNSQIEDRLQETEDRVRRHVGKVCRWRRQDAEKGQDPEMLESSCGEELGIYATSTVPPKYCPNCGGFVIRVLRP